MKRKTRDYWTKKTCTIEALKYENRSEFKKKSGGAYNSCLKNDWLHNACSHMQPIGNRFKRLIYIYEFSDNSVYIGLTFNIKTRDNKHKRDKRSAVYKHIKKTGLIPKLTYSDYIDVNKAIDIEIEKVEYYKKNGYSVLNTAKAGSIGGNNLKWTFENCKKEALKYISRKKFYLGNNSAYNSARKNNWLNDVCYHMNTKKVNKKGYWTKEKCADEVLKYKSKIELYKNSPGAYMYLLRNGLLNDVCINMRTKKTNGYWTKDRCFSEAVKFNTRSEFYKKSSGAYRSALCNDWLEEICFHMKTLKSKKV